MLVGMQGAAGFPGADSLAKIVGQGRQHEPVGICGPVAELCGFVQHHHGMGPDVPFGMVFGRLRHTDQGLQLREPVVQLIHLPQNFKEDRGPFRFQQGLFQFSFDPFPGQVLQRHGPAYGNGRICYPEPEPGGKLGCPEDPQGILGEGTVADMPQDTGFQILHAAEMVHDLAGEYILHQGVDGKIPAAGSGFRADEGIHKDLEIPVPPAPGFFLPGHSDIQIIALQPENTKALTNGDPLSQGIQDLGQTAGRDAMDLDVHILVLPLHQGIPNKAAHVESPAALPRHQPGHFPGNFPAIHLVHDLTSFFLFLLPILRRIPEQVKCFCGQYSQRRLIAGGKAVILGIIHEMCLEE